MRVEDIILKIKNHITYEGEILNNTNLFGLGIIDSMLMFELVFELEEELGIEFDGEELIPENFQTPEKIIELINRQIR